MKNSHDPVLLALIATLDEQARKHVGKSLIKRVVSRLVAAGADDAAIAELRALKPKSKAAASPKTAKPPEDAAATVPKAAPARAKTARTKDTAPGVRP